MFRPKKVLVVDDSSLSRKIARQHLEGLGYEVAEAPDGMLALEEYAIEQQDLVILDLLMSGMTGLEVLKVLKQMNPSLPVIVVSADIQHATRTEVREAGAIGLLNKPLNKDMLAELLETIAQGRTGWTD